jgi:citrate synthase
MPPSRLVTAAEAAQRLGVSRASLYAYVSRGLIRSVPSGDDLRCRLYVSADVEMLVRQKALTRGPVAASASALNLGLPILETRVSGIVAGRLVYRGLDAVALAETHGMEEVAHLLWDAGDAASFSDPDFHPWLEPEWLRTAGVLAAASPTDRAQALLSLLAHEPGFLAGREPPDGAARLVMAVANAVVGCPLPPEVPLHAALARAWATPAAGDVIRRALVLSAENELNPSTFTVRVVASTGATLVAAVTAGLAALGGSRQGGLPREFDALYGERAWAEGGEAVLARIGREAPPPGFGHPLYPDGDPRAAALMRHLDVPPPLARVVAAVEDATGLRPNLALALWMIEETQRLPPDAALSLYAIGRSVGWIAHAMEQQAVDIVIRPRAKFIFATKAEPGPA